MALGVFALSLLAVLLLLRAFGLSPIVQILVLLPFGAVLGFACQVLFAAPVPYEDNSRVCIRCGRPEAPFAHPGDDICIDCHGQRPL